jgi:hypothetical protein
MAVQEHLASLKLAAPLKVDALLFAPPNMGDATFAAAFGKMVNLRRIAFKYDVIPQVPCAPSMVGCKDALVNTSTARNQGLWTYAQTPGTLLLEPASMPQQAEAWSRLDSIHACEAKRFFKASHYCSYSCFLSRYAHGNANNMCRLWPDAVAGGGRAAAANKGSAGTTAGTYCFDYPIVGKDQYPPRPSPAA